MQAVLLNENLKDFVSFSLEGFEFFVKKELNLKLESLNLDKFNRLNLKKSLNLNGLNFKDDLSIIREVFRGNKARKLAFFFKHANDFKPGTHFISFGGAQSNALAALAAFSFHFDFKLIFITTQIPGSLRQNPSGNLALALNLKAHILEKPEFMSLKDYALSLCEGEDIFMPQGLSLKEAAFGYKELANEILSAQESLNLDFKDKKSFKFDIFLPSGTGTAALFLAQNLPQNKIYTCACVGDEPYLKAQISSLEPSFNFKNLHILSLKQKYPFAKPHKDLLNIYQKALNAGLEFDLLYDTLALLCVLEHQKDFQNPLLYIHQGGILGNLTQLQRYKKGAYF